MRVSGVISLEGVFYWRERCVYKVIYLAEEGVDEGVFRMMYCG